MRFLSGLLLSALACCKALGSPLTFIANISRVVAEVPRSIVGFGVEDANFQIYGGLYSQLIFGESFEEPDLAGYLHHQTWLPGGLGQATLTREDPFNGKQSLRLQCLSAAACGVSNMGLDRWGISVEGKRPYHGYLFARGSSAFRVGLCQAHNAGVLPAPQNCHTQSDVLRTPAGNQVWSMHNFTLFPGTSDANASFVIWVENETSTGNVRTMDFDMVFLEPGDWARYKGLHVRSDLANAILCNQTTGFLRFGGDIADSGSFKWENMRGPAWLRPPCLGCSWNPYSSNGFGMFEMLEFREASGIERFVLDLSVGENGAVGKCGHPAETFDAVADLIEYLFGDAGTTTLGRLRNSDGHPKPYDHNGLIFEVSNECPLSDLYLKGFNSTISAMVARAALVAPNIKLAFGSMGNYAFNPASLPQNLALAELVQHWAERSVTIYADQHINGGSGMETLQGIANLDTMQQWLLSKGSPMKVYVGEENCAADKRIPNDDYCHGIERALFHVLQSNAYHRMGSTFIVGHALVTTFGPTGKQWSWPQGSIEFGSRVGSVLLQPPWRAQDMIGRSFRSQVLESLPARYNNSNGSFVDVLLLKDHQGERPDFVLRIASSYRTYVSVSLSLLGSSTELSASIYSQRWTCQVLSCGENPAAVNSWEHPQTCVTKDVSSMLALHHSNERHALRLDLRLEPLSFTLCTADMGLGWEGVLI